jgi:hypothetical protein
MPWARAVTVPLAAAVLVAASGPVLAGEHEWRLGALPSVGVVQLQGRRPLGAGIGIDLGYGLRDFVTLRGTLVYGLHPVDEVKQPALAGGLAELYAGYAGIEYALDVLRFIPFFDLSVGALLKTEPGREAVWQLLVQGGIGLDYLYSRTFAVGFGARYHFAPTDVGGFPFYLYAGPRILMRWD